MGQFMEIKNLYISVEKNTWELRRFIMAGNYDVTNVTARNGIDNTSSFRTGKNGKKVFIGTDWNETAHITNDKNQGTIFEADKGMTLQLNSRYKNGGADVFSNLDRKHTGISFDLLDKFIAAAADGILEDVDHQGYTDANKVAFGKAFDELRKQKLAAAQNDPYGKEYTKMKHGTEFNFTASELETLYKAAGFDLVKKKPAPAEPDPAAEPPKPDKPVVPVEPTPVPEPEPVGGDGRAIEVTNGVLTTILGLDSEKYADYKYVGYTKESANGVDAFVFKLQKDGDVITIKKNADQIQQLLKEHPEMKEQLIADELELDKADLQGTGAKKAEAEVTTQPEQPAAPAKPKKSDYYNTAILGGAFMNAEDRAKHDEGKIKYQWALAEYYDSIGDTEAAEKAVQKAVELEGKVASKK